MQRDGAIIFGVLGIGLIIGIAILASGAESNKLSLATAQQLPVIGVLGTTATPLTTSLPTPSSPQQQVIGTQEAPSVTPSVTPPLQTKTPRVTPTTRTTSCRDTTIRTEISKKANDFMKTHKEKDVTKVLSLISLPKSSADQQELDFLLGKDNNNTPRLYQLTATTYVTKSYSINLEPNSIIDRGDDLEERGTKRCQVILYEVRSREINGTFQEETVTRFLDFTVDQSNIVSLSAFRDKKDGKKYSGFY